ncbi:hypothetical protein VOI32_32900 [Paraburkholderia caribensis]|uniref:Stability determinant domain-containing protein n=2 Tax=Paraburkholderia TaxID=1822464 RepID=B2JY21_PARP8|nr:MULTISPECIES: hypothetical protein [Paraburkholderia]ACC76529.1 conserved hypothetical protein [Paraburkholderia phymatum STM815]MCO4880982.1 hypothetical protein [Paraburkholderia caribensis]PTB25785.1 hypothetical protein C9I56_26625 [Paraburkholderia caribensis]
MATETIDQKTLSQLVEAGAVRAAHVVGHGNGWTISAHYGRSERFLAAKRGDVRVFRKLETLVSFLRDMGISHFDVDAAGYDPQTAGRVTRPDRSAALKEAHAARAYDRWFREQVRESLDDPRPNVPHAQVQQEMAEKKAALRRKIARTGAKS